jgi:hypothetical protein
MRRFGYRVKMALLNKAIGFFFDCQQRGAAGNDIAHNPLAYRGAAVGLFPPLPFCHPAAKLLIGKSPVLGGTVFVEVISKAFAHVAHVSIRETLLQEKVSYLETDTGFFLSNNPFHD